jgi:hypothetical protein
MNLDFLNYDVKPYMSNPYVMGILVMVLFLYSSVGRDHLPLPVYRAFKNPMFNFLFFMAIVIVGTQDFRAAFVIALLYAFIQHQFSQTKIAEAFLAGPEGFDGTGYEDHMTY